MSISYGNDFYGSGRYGYDMNNQVLGRNSFLSLPKYNSILKIPTYSLLADLPKKTRTIPLFKD